MTHQFWDNQPVMHKNDFVMKGGAFKTLEKNDTPTKLPDKFTWDLSPSISDVCTFLNYFYYESFGKKIKHHFTEEYLELYYRFSKLHVAVRSEGVIIAFIGASKSVIKLNKAVFDSAYVNHACIQPKYRNKRLMPVLIREITRLLTNEGINQIFYNTTKAIHKPLATLEYCQRSINVDLLMKVGILAFEKDSTIDIEEVKKNFYLPNKPMNKNFVEMQESHIDAAFEKFTECNDKYNFSPVCPKESFRQILLNNKIVKSYVLLNDDGEVLDFVSYYVTFAKVDNCFIKKGNVFYYSDTVETSYRLINDMMICSKKDNIDMFCGYNIMNNDVLKDLKFSKHGAETYLYLSNWRYLKINPNQVGFVPIF